MLNSIRVSTRVAIASALGLPIAFWALGTHTMTAFDNYRRAEVISSQNSAANALIAGVYEILIERQHVNNALQADNPATASDLTEIARYRNAARSKIGAAYADLVKHDFPGKAAAISEFKTALEKAEDYRRKSDAAIKLPKAQRDPDVVKSSYPVLSAFVTTGQSLWNKVLRSTSQLDTELGRLANIRILAWTMRDTAGRERAAISGAMSAKSAIPAEGLITIRTIRAQVNQLWSLLQANLAEPDHPALTKGLESIKAGYFGKFQPLGDQMRKVSAEGASYPIALGAWVETTTPLLATILDVMQGANQASEARTTEFQSTATRELVVSLGLLLLGVLLACAAAAYAVVTIARPMRALTTGMLELAGGNFSVKLAGLGRKDEIGDIAGAVETFKIKAAEKAQQEAQAKAELDRQAVADREALTARVMSEFDNAIGGIAKAAMQGDFSQRVPLDGKEGVIRNIAASMNALCDTVGQVFDETVHMLGAMSKGDLTVSIRTQYQGAFAVLKDNANATVQRLSETMAEIQAAAGEVSNASQEISTATTDLSQRTEEQAASLEQTSASMEQISATVKKNAENAHQAKLVTATTSDAAARGGAVVGQAVEAMSRIADSSKKIADIIGVIDEIARQTNLLALNAAVEAARAGEAGRGFAVVAAEVRSLAQRSAQAAKDIKDLITNSGAQVKDGVDLVNRAGGSLTEIVASIRSVAEIVAAIANASAEQATGIDQVNRALSQMDGVTQQNSALVEENAATAKTLEQQAQHMDERISFFDLGAPAALLPSTARAA
jgi:methyl-accepting chemotaxis protein